MKKSDNKKLIRRYIEEVENTGDVSKIREFIADEYTEVFEGQRYPIGVQGAIDHVLGVRRVYPDLNLTIEHQIAEGDWVATVYSVTGTFSDEWLGIQPTGKQITYTGVNVDRIKEGKIVEHGGAANLMNPLLQAGVLLKKRRK